MSDVRTPLALFTYNRAGYVGQALASLARCRRLEECRVHLFCDGPKGEHDRAAVEASRAAVREWAPKLQAEVIERQENYGLAKSIVTGVTGLCDRHGRVIVLEDDMQVSPDFLDYMLQALDRYENATQVYQISAYMFAVEFPSTTDAVFLPLTTTRGWATWARAWRIFDWQSIGAREQLADPAVRRRFDLDGSYAYSEMLDRRLSGRNDSWGILWWWSVFKAGGLALHPRTSLVWMGGFDGTGTHCGPSALKQDKLEAMQVRRLDDPIRFPATVTIDERAFTAVKEFLTEGQVIHSDSVLSHLRHRMKRFVMGR